MPRSNRKRSKTGIYHVMLRGIDKRDIFEEDEDRAIFLKCLKKSKEKSKFQLFSYCLMNNHVHLLIKENSETIGQSIRRLLVSYAIWHNRKYDRTGHLFQNRYYSECVETETYLLTVTRYIHQNPLNAGLVKDIQTYPWSSHSLYLEGLPSIIDYEVVMGYFNNINSYNEFMNESVKDKCIDDELRNYCTDEALRSRIEKICSLHHIKGMDKERRNQVIAIIKKDTKASNRQISRVIGVGRGIVERVKIDDK